MTRNHGSCFNGKVSFFFLFFCLDEISFRRDYKFCRIGVVRCRCSLSMSFVPDLWELCDGITSVILELHFWDLVHCLLISFCFGSEILKKIGSPQPLKKPKNPQKKTGFELGWGLVQCFFSNFYFFKSFFLFFFQNFFFKVFFLQNFFSSRFSFPEVHCPLCEQ